MNRRHTNNGRRQRAQARPTTTMPHDNNNDDKSVDRAGDGTGRATLRIELVDKAEIPGGGGTLQLLRRGDDFSIEFESEELMGNRDYLSEQALATMTCERLGSADGDILVGGLGMGFTLGAALSAWSAQASITVAELVPSVVTWAKGPLAHLFNGHLDDPRVRLRLGDVYDEIRTARPESYDAILLDVDNGPDWFVKPENDRLYCDWGLREAYTALRPRGVLAVWSSFSDARFIARLETVGFDVEQVRVPAYPGSRDHWHMIIFASKPAV